MMLRMYLALGPARAQGAAPPVQPAGPSLPASVAGLAHWGSVHHAWQDATDACPSDTLVKEPLPVGVLIAIAEHRVRAIRVLRDALDREPGLRRRIDALQPQVRDTQGRNWNIPALNGGPSPRASDEAEFRRIVDALRDQFDLA